MIDVSANIPTTAAAVKVTTRVALKELGSVVPNASSVVHNSFTTLTSDYHNFASCQ